MRKLTCTLLIIAILGGCGLLLIGNVHAVTFVGSPPSNTPWNLGLTQTFGPSPVVPTLEPASTPTPTPSPGPTPKATPGSPLSFGSSTFAEVLSQFDLMRLAKLVLVVLGIIWVIIILVSVDRKFAHKDNKKQ